MIKPVVTFTVTDLKCSEEDCDKVQAELVEQQTMKLLSNGHRVVVTTSKKSYRGGIMHSQIGLVADD